MSMHVLLPVVFGGDGDKCVCTVRVSQQEDRRGTADLQVFLDAPCGCEVCYLRTLRTWQQHRPGINPDPATWPCFPWEETTDAEP